jgi:hypothetical protein
MAWEKQLDYSAKDGRFFFSGIEANKSSRFLSLHLMSSSITHGALPCRLASGQCPLLLHTGRQQYSTGSTMIDHLSRHVASRSHPVRLSRCHCHLAWAVGTSPS